MEQADPVLVSNTREWLARAKEDPETAAFTLTAPQPFVRSALFHCEQAVEKAMKAFLTWHDVPFRKTHNLVELGDACATIQAGLTPAVDEVAALTKYAIRFRYPGAPYEPLVEEAREALRIARSFLETVVQDLPAIVVPDTSSGAQPPDFER